MFWELVIVFFTGTTKWAFIALFILKQNVWVLDLLVAYIGGVSGIFIYTFFGEKLTLWFSKFKKPKVFKMNKRKRMLVKIKTGYGLMGIALISPLLISLPAGCILSFSLTENKWEIIKYQLLSLSIWAGLLGIIKLFI
jgi:hypothetical protein